MARSVDGVKMHLLKPERSESPLEPKKSESVHRDSCDAKDKPSDNFEVACQPEATSIKLTINTIHNVETLSAGEAIEKICQ